MKFITVEQLSAATQMYNYSMLAQYFALINLNRKLKFYAEACFSLHLILLDDRLRINQFQGGE